jgi:dihydrofolate synthase/folylpolyglutamate synthase
VTYFELLTAAGFLYFAEQAVDLAVIEVGVGGRLDATNVITPEVCALASIQLEHTDLLGNSLERIAREKAGIIKAGVPVLSVPQSPEVVAIFREVSAAAGSTLAVIGQEIEFSHRFETSAELGTHARVVLTTQRSTFEHLAVPLRGEHQAYNCGLVLAILDALRARGFETPETLVAQGLNRTPPNGRLEQVHAQPRVIVDGAHTPDSIHALIKTIGSHMRYDSLVVVFGCAADKDVPGMLQKLSLGADKIIFTKASGSHRAMDPRELQRRFAEHSHNKMTQTAGSVRDAINLAGLAVSRGDLVIVTGSFLIAGEAKRLFMEKQQATRAGGRSGEDAAPLPEVKPRVPKRA